MDNNGLRPSKSPGFSTIIYHPLIEHQPAKDEVVVGTLHFGGTVVAFFFMKVKLMKILINFFIGLV